jgi:hypothetical protein
MLDFNGSGLSAAWQSARSAMPALSSVIPAASAVAAVLSAISALRSASSARQAQEFAVSAERRSLRRNVESAAREMESERSRIHSIVPYASRARRDLAVFNGVSGGWRKQTFLADVQAKRDEADRISREILFEVSRDKLECLSVGQMDLLHHKLCDACSRTKGIRDDLERALSSCQAELDVHRQRNSRGAWR